VEGTLKSALKISKSYLGEITEIVIVWENSDFRKPERRRLILEPRSNLNEFQKIALEL